MPHAPTVTVHFSQALQHAADALGYTLPEPLVAALAAQQRVDLSLQDTLWEHIREQAQDPLVGVRFGQSIETAHLDTVGMILMSCETLNDALTNLRDYYPIVGEGGEFTLSMTDDTCAVRYTPQFTVCREIRVEAAMSALLNLARRLTAQALPHVQLRFAHAPHTNDAQYLALLDAPVTFNATDNALLLPRSALTLPLIYANPALCEHLRTLADKMLASLEHGSLSVKVRDTLNTHPDWGKEKVAEQLAMSGRHLVRKLAEEGTSFKLLRDAQLQHLAEQGLQRGLRLHLLAEQLGFSDESAFAKAFKRWTGMTPVQFRDR